MLFGGVWQLASDAWVAPLGSSHLDNVAGRHGDLTCHHRNHDRSWNARYTLSSEILFQSAKLGRSEARNAPHSKASMPLKATGSLKNRGSQAHLLGGKPLVTDRGGGVSSGRNKKGSSGVVDSTRVRRLPPAHKISTRRYFLLEISWRPDIEPIHDHWRRTSPSSIGPVISAARNRGNWKLGLLVDI